MAGASSQAASRRRLTVAVTGPTGDIGRSLLRALQASRDIAEVRAMGRRPFDPAAEGLTKVRYQRADVLDATTVRDVIAGADVVVHLAFMIMGSAQETTEINLQGSRNVFGAAIDLGVPRLVYASSVAAYGFAADNPELLTEDLEPRGTERHYYSAQKAELELTLRALLQGAETEAWIMRPCIVAGPDALTMVQSIPYVQISERMPSAVLRALSLMPALHPVIPDPGVPFQLVHHDYVAQALRLAILGRGEPGVYNLAAAGTLTMRDLANALGWYSIPVGELALGAAAELVARLPFVPAGAQWIESMRRPVLMDTHRARRVLGWRPRHDAHETLEALVQSARAEQLIR